MDGASKPVKIKYCSLEDGLIKETEDLVAESFAPDEMLLSLCRNCEGGRLEDHWSWIPRLVRDHSRAVSRLALDANTGRVVGVCLSDVGTASRPSQAMEAITTNPSEMLRLVTSFLQQLEGGYDVYKALGVEKILHINVAAVDKGYRRQGISLELRRQSIELARQLGCQAAVDCASSPFTRRALAKLGFERERFIPFTESVLASNEKVDLASCGPEDGVALMVRLF